MKWEAPSFVEVKMDSEIGSYQDDFGDIPDINRQPEQAERAVGIATPIPQTHNCST